MNRRLRLLIPLIFIILVTVFGGCASRKAPSPAMPALEQGPLPKSPPIHEETTARANAELPDVDRRIIYEAEITLVVQDTKAAADDIEQLAKQLGGYVVEANLYRREGTLVGNMTLRVPQERFEDALARLSALAVRVDRQSIHTQDVTSEYVDLEARLKNLEATEEELRALLKEVREQTKSASDIMEVYRELTRVREQIEQIKGRLQMLDKLTTYATIRVELTPYALSQPLSSRPWDPRVTLYHAWGTLLNVLQLLANAFIYLIIVVIPALALVLIPIAIVMHALRWLWRHTRGKKAQGS